MDWTQFTLKVRIKSPLQEVYDAWSDRNKIVTWFLATCDQLDPVDDRSHIMAGDKVEWSWHNYPNHSPIEVLAANGKNHIAFTFGEGMEVAIHLEKENDYTVLTLIQYNIPTDDESKYNYYLGCSRAWSTWMLNLKSWLEHDSLLHDTTLGMREDLFQFINT